jgi:transposase
MKLTEERYEKIKHCLPKQRGNVKIDNKTLINALLYICENGCKWRSLPSEFGDWHVIYVRYSRWVENGVIAKLFEELAKHNLLETPAEHISLDSTSVKVHPDAAGALKKMVSSLSEGQRADSQQKSI